MRAVLPQASPPSFEPQTGRVADPTPGPGEVVIRVRAAGVNHADLMQLRGRYPVPPGEPEIPGLECAGEVVATGAAEDGDPPAWHLGDRVMALLGGGGLAERVAVPVGQILALPDPWSFEEGAAFPEAALTAWTNLVAEGGLRTGETVLVSGSTGAVGRVAVQLARELGATVVASGRDERRLAELEEYGIHHRILDSPGSLREQLERVTGDPDVDLVLDLVGGEGLAERVHCLALRGRLVLLGLLAGTHSELDLARVLRRRLRLLGSQLRSRSRAEKALLVRGFLAFAGERLEDGRIRSPLGKVFGFDRVAEAFRTVHEGGSPGRVVVQMNE